MRGSQHININSARRHPASFILAGLWVAALILPRALAEEVKMEDPAIAIAFDSRSGALTRLADKSTGWIIERRPELGDSFRLFAPLPERRWNPVLGTKQVAREVKKISDHEIRLEWRGLASENGGELPITLAADVTLTNGVLAFNATLQNDSPLTIESIDYPWLGDLSPPSPRTNKMSACLRVHGDLEHLLADEIYPHFRNEKGYWGVFWPTKIFDGNSSPFCLVQSGADGLYVGADSAPPYLLRYTFEQHPGLVSSVTSLVPSADEIGGRPVHLEFRVCHLVFLKPHSTMKLATVIVRGYQGGERAGIEIFKQSPSPPSPSPDPNK